MRPYIKNLQLPPKKKKSLDQKDLTIRLSFGEPFTNVSNEAISRNSENSEDSKDSDNNSECASKPLAVSPCWVLINLCKFIDINILKNAE